MSTVTRQRKAVVVGAGPVGCLAALSLAKDGWQVEIYDGRPDMRLPSSQAAGSLRSINLAISARGISAIESVDPAVARRFMENVIPMKGRMIHDISGSQHSQLYDGFGRCINSIDRGLLNLGLLEEISAAQNITVFFRHKLTTVDFDGRCMTFSSGETGKDVIVTFDFCVGADGSYSNVRRQMMRVVRMNFQQEYIPHEYMELKIPAGKGDAGQATFALDPNHLHIWPRHSFMLIALPNKDKSFTCTLFAPTTEFSLLDDPPSALAWFQTNFPDALPLIGPEQMLESLKRNPRSPLIVIKATPYHYKDRAVILGDAAHSMVPFFGQGLNCGLEDVRVLSAILRNEAVDPTNLEIGSGESVDPNLERALLRYSATRHEDLVAISDLAMNNYVEMRHSVATPAYLFRRSLDLLFSYFTPRAQVVRPEVEKELSQVPFPSASASPGGWVPLYTMVTFRPDISYTVAKHRAERQDRIISDLAWGITAFGCLAIGVAAWKRCSAL